jgi:hypothetical protein
MVFVGDLLAGQFDVADTQVEPFPDSAQLLASLLHAMMLSQRHSEKSHRNGSPSYPWLRRSTGSNYNDHGRKEQGRKRAFVRFSEQP